MEIKITLNDIEAFFGFDNFVKIAWNILDIPENGDFFHELAKCEWSSIRAVVARNESLKDETIQLFLKDNSPQVMSKIIKHKRITKFISVEHIEKLFDTFNFEAICFLLERIDNIENDDAQTLLIEKVMKCKEPEFRLRLLDHTSNKKLLRMLANDKQGTISYAARTKLN
ncbi:MAG: hypothetical protein NT007_00280 [Candidatus Kapabacteria bacterium]|nr:hypothetical protein [Candidatus Kapabacteria bacterium]